LMRPVGAPNFRGHRTAIQFARWREAISADKESGRARPRLIEPRLAVLGPVWPTTEVAATVTNLLFL